MEKKLSDFIILKINENCGIKNINSLIESGNEKKYEKWAKHHRKNNNLFWLLYEHVTKNEKNRIIFNYAASVECATEELLSDYGIIVIDHFDYFYYLIPKENIELHKWLLNNVGDMKVVYLKKPRIILKFYNPSTYFRTTFKLETDWHEKFKNNPDKN